MLRFPEEYIATLENKRLRNVDPSIQKIEGADLSVACEDTSLFDPLESFHTTGKKMRVQLRIGNGSKVVSLADVNVELWNTAHVWQLL